MPDHRWVYRASLRRRVDAGARGYEPDVELDGGLVARGFAAADPVGPVRG